jgi:hypothetical protein
MLDWKKNLFYETEIPKVKIVKMLVFWDVMLCTLEDCISCTLKMGAVFSFEMLIIAQMSNEFCPKVKLCNLNVFFFFALITDMKSVL